MLPPPVSEPATHQQLTTYQQFTYIIQVQINLTNPQLSPDMTPLLPLTDTPEPHFPFYHYITTRKLQTRSMSVISNPSLST